MSAEETRPPAENVDGIQGWHAHVYFDTETAPVAERVRNAVSEKFDVQMGRWHERLVGPHPRWSYQIAFAPELFGALMSLDIAAGLQRHLFYGLHALKNCHLLQLL